MGWIARARIWALGIRKSLWQVGIYLRIALMKAVAVVIALPETVRDQVRQWRGHTVELPVEEQRMLLAEYYTHFEQLSELICDSAFAEEGAPWQAEYQRLRKWFQRAYPQIRPYLTAHLNCDPSDTEFGLRTVGRPTDAMEALFCAETLDEILRHDGGYLIGRLERARSALYRYGDYLRTYLERTDA